MRYGFNAPTSWAFDLSYITYGTLFTMGGAYTLSRGDRMCGRHLPAVGRGPSAGRTGAVFPVFLPGYSR